MVPLLLEWDGRRISFGIQRVVNIGYSGRDRGLVERHVAELMAMGVPPPREVPVLYPLPSDRITMGDTIDVLDPCTSGEAEFVLFCTGSSVYVGVGSDHTDRRLERQNVLLSKLVCPNVVSRLVWRYEDVRDHWDSLELRSWVSRGAENRAMCQEGTLGELLPCGELLEIVRSRSSDGRLDGTVVFSGTIPLLTSAAAFGDGFEVQLADPVRRASLCCRYLIKQLTWLTRPD